MAKAARAALEPTENLDAQQLFESYLTEAIPEATLLKYERLYIKETAEQKLTQDVQFDYAVCLIKSRFSADIKKGIILMEELAITNPTNNREHLYFLSLGYARLKRYSTALSIIKSFLKVEPENAQMLNWQKFLQYKVKKEATIGLAVTTGTALVVGGLIGLGISLLKR